MHKSNTELLKKQLLLATSRIHEEFNDYIIEFDPYEKEQPKTNFDEIMNFWVLPNKVGKRLNLENVCDLLVTAHNELPLWIRIDMDFEKKAFLLFISKRFRKIKEINNWHQNNDLRPIIIKHP